MTHKSALLFKLLSARLVSSGAIILVAASLLALGSCTSLPATTEYICVKVITHTGRSYGGQAVVMDMLRVDVRSSEIHVSFGGGPAPWPWESPTILPKNGDGLYLLMEGAWGKQMLDLSRDGVRVLIYDGDGQIVQTQSYRKRSLSGRV